VTVGTSLRSFAVIQDGVRYEFQPAEEGGYVVSVPAAKGCWSEGDSFEDAFENIGDALRLWLAVASEKSFTLSPELQRLAAAT
jgi:predicted RNase H-like HicB family nuclease